MGKTEETNKLLGEHIVNKGDLETKYANKPIVFSHFGMSTYDSLNWSLSTDSGFYGLMQLPNWLGWDDQVFFDSYIYADTMTPPTPTKQNIYYAVAKSFLSMYKGSYRWVGVVNGTNDDASIDVSIYCNKNVNNANDLVKLKLTTANNGKAGDTKRTGGGYLICYEHTLTKLDDNAYEINLPTFLTQETNTTPSPRGNGIYLFENTFGQSTQNAEYELKFEHRSYGVLHYPKLFSDCSRYWRLGDGTVAPTPERIDRPELTAGKLNNEYVGFRVGIPRIVPTWLSEDYKKDIGPNKLHVSGKMYDYAQNLYTEKFYNKYNHRSVTQSSPTIEPVSYQTDAPLYTSFNKTFAYGFIPYNLILTYSEESARLYLEQGVLPGDAFVFDFDEIESFDTDQPFPATDGTPGDAGGDDDGGMDDDDVGDNGDEPGETGDNGRDTTPTPLSNPSIAPQQLSNNNIYWLQAGQLESFITWFWTQAGEIIDIDDLWEKIIGQYSDLVSAILNVRYMPIDPAWVGGLTDNDKIVISRIYYGCPNSYAIGNGKPVIRNIGTIKIEPKYKTFCDYSPYSSLTLYLPFHGFIDLDIDLLMGHDLGVSALYDIISGTMQYFIYCDDYIINTCIAKMAVDLPLTLQSKSDRDSAIFGNVASATGNLLGAGVSAATGNPIGLVMSTANAVNGGQNTAPLKLMGTQGETGSFYAPAKCAIYLKFPAYNRPSIYKSVVGFPLNKQYKLSDLSGLTMCYNAKIDKFTHDALPFEDEYNEICTLLETGVYI